MTIELIDIFIKIVEGINHKHPMDKIIEDVNRTRKVNKNIIAAIYSWIYEKLNRDIAAKLEENPVSEGIRILSLDEQEFFGAENYNYVLHLYNLGLLNSSDIEKIMDQALNIQDDELQFEQLNLIILSIFLESNADLPPGSRFLLYSSDTIN
jgi:uncharacterized protein Smg (DUF494 family)